MTESKYKFSIQTSNNGVINIPLKEGKSLFVLGANGVGKSTLMHNLFHQNFDHSKRILAHRQTWFNINSINLTAYDKTQHEQQIRNLDRQINSRWKDDYSGTRAGITIFDLIHSENIRARNITSAVDADDLTLAKRLSEIQAPLQGINELLAIANIPITIIREKNDQLFAVKNGSAPYSIAELSDGERNALLICSDVLTSPPHHVIIIDEPERHLHRSIISPLLSSLFQKRNDCVFVISTHDVHLPIDHSDASVLLLRSCSWNGKSIRDWDIDLIQEVDSIPSVIKEEILGSKRRILFVEGVSDSLDRQIYQLIYPTVTVIPQGGCVQVEKAVDGIKGTENLHWIEAYGLIDSDDRTEEQIKMLLQKGIAAVEPFSVESLYYNLEIVNRVASRYAEITGKDKDQLFNQATSGIVNNIISHKERLCARRCEKKIRTQAMTHLPKYKDIIHKGNFEYKLNLKNILEEEESVFDKMISENNLNGLIARYPIRETQILNGIVSGLGLTRDTYESVVKKLIVDDKEIREFYRSLLSNLTQLMER